MVIRYDSFSELPGPLGTSWTVRSAPMLIQVLVKEVKKINKISTIFSNLPGLQKSGDRTYSSETLHMAAADISMDAGMMDLYSRQIGAFGLETMQKVRYPAAARISPLAVHTYGR